MPSRPRRPGAFRLVTLASDLGAAYAAQIKAVLLRRLPPGSVVDLTHDLRPHDLREAAFVVRAMAERFPSGSVHLVVVDPGVGGVRAPVVVDCRDRSVLVGPDNGVLFPLAEALGGGTAYRIDPARLLRSPRVGTTFDGRDVFAPAAAAVASGTAPRRLGPRTTLHRLPSALPRRTRAGALGAVAHVDRFGNLITDVPASWVPPGTVALDVTIGRAHARVPFGSSYEHAGRGRAVALGSSFGTLELAVNLGRASDRWPAPVGTRLRFRWREAPPLALRRKR
ncbi:MAG TPA: SAM-dependent chlorinase/fluorinase [Thermoplasmata archaeon]|nr:SAM-dependent chlorinase/fluorinase [Thermoplasmata archaeon]